MEERSGFLFKLAAVLAVIGVIIAVIVYFVVRSSMEDIKSTDYDWKNPALVFADGTEMTGSAVSEGIRSFDGYAVSFEVHTLDGVVRIYNFDGEKSLPTYDTGQPVTAEGYINPSGRFLVESGAAADGKVARVVLRQN